MDAICALPNGQSTRNSNWLRRRAAGVVVVAISVSYCGCTSTAFRKDKATIETNPNAGTSVQLVRDLARAWGLQTLKVEGVSMVKGLNGTGGDAPPSSEREMLLEEMRIHEVEKPSLVLGSKHTALVTVQAYLPPGVQKGDPIDVEVRVPPRHEIESIQGGWLMPTRLREYAKVKNRVATGHVLAAATGDVLVDSLFDGGQDEITKNRGRVLGGGVATKSRNLGLLVRDEHLSVATSARIGEAVNKRFHIYDRGLQRPVANPKRDRFIEVLVHPRYRDNVIRYVRVIQSIPVRFGAGGIAARLNVLRTQFSNPDLAAATAIQLEALGADGVPVLEGALQQANEEVVFYAAEALAYLNKPTAVDALVAAIRDEPAFRQRAFTALGAMDAPEAHEALVNLLHHDSVESRYAAFRTLRRNTPDDQSIYGKKLGKFHYHTVVSHGEPLVHATRAERPEIVLFGKDHPLKMPLVVYAGDRIVVRGDDSGVRVTKITPGEENESTKCAPQLDALVRAIVDLGGDYPDVVQAIVQAKENGALESRLEFAAIPKANRTYQRQSPVTVSDEIEDHKTSQNRPENVNSAIAKSDKRTPRNPLREASSSAKPSSFVARQPLKTEQGKPVVAYSNSRLQPKAQARDQNRPAETTVGEVAFSSQPKLLHSIASDRTVPDRDQIDEQAPLPPKPLAALAENQDASFFEIAKADREPTSSFLRDPIYPDDARDSHARPDGAKLAVRSAFTEGSLVAATSSNSSNTAVSEVAPEPQAIQIESLVGGKSGDFDAKSTSTELFWARSAPYPNSKKRLLASQSLATVSDTIKFGQ